MKISQHAKKLAKDLELSDADAAIMELKSLLYERAAQAIQHSRIPRGPPLNSELHGHLPVSAIEEKIVFPLILLLRIIVVLEKKIPFRLVAA